MTNYRILFDITRTHLLSRIKQSSIAALGVTFGISTFIILVSFMTGLNGMLDGLVLNRTPHIQIYNELKPSAVQPIDRLAKYKEAFSVIRSIKPKKNQTRIHNGLPLVEQFKKDPRVKGVTTQISAPVLYITGSIELSGMVLGLDVTEESRLYNFDEYFVEGTPADLTRNNNGILLGIGLAKNTSLQVGDRIQISTTKGGIFSLKIVGLYQSGIADIDDTFSYVNLKTAQQLLGESGSYISNINLKLHDIEQAPAMAIVISKQLGMTALDISKANAQFDTGTNIRNLITYAVSITVLLVAGFGIYNILNMLIYEKMNDIAILKATGFSGRDVQIIFISQAIIIGFIGGALGLLLGYGVSVLIDNVPFNTDALPTIKTYPVNFDPKYYIIGVIFAMVSTFLAGYLPSLRAKGIDPVKIIRSQ